MIAELVLVLGTMGCGGGPMDQQLPPSRRRGDVRTIDTLGVESIVPASAARIWAILPVVLVDLGLEITFREPAAQRIGACYQKIRVRLGSHQLSDFIDCGDDRGLPNADRFEVALTVLTTVVPTGAETATLYTFVLGVALNASGASGNRLWCYSKGGLEERIRAAVEARLSG